MNETLLSILIALVVPAAAIAVIAFLERTHKPVPTAGPSTPITLTPLPERFTAEDWKARLNAPFKPK